MEGVHIYCIVGLYRLVKRLEENPAEHFSFGKAVFIVALLLIALFAFPVFAGEVSYFVTLENSTGLDHVSDNRIGALVVQSNSDIPAYFKTPEFEACIYPGENSSPLIVPVETEKSSFVTSKEIKRSNLTVSIPREKLDMNGLNREFEPVKRDRCPLRGNSTIVLVEKSKN